MTSKRPSDLKRLKSQDESDLSITLHTIKPEHFIICEKQERHYCGRHALRTLVQRLDLFTDEYLQEVANNLAAEEQLHRDGDFVQTLDYYIPDNGDYDIQVLRASLINLFSVDIIQIDKLAQTGCRIRNAILSHIESIQAILVHEDYHYYCLRRFRSSQQYVFRIDSLHPAAHKPIHQRNFINYLHCLLECGANLYVVFHHCPGESEENISLDTIQARLWPLPDAPADAQSFTVFDENE